MAYNLGRDKLWTPDTWADIDKAVQSEVGRLRVAQKVFPAVQAPNAANVSADVLDPATMTIQEGITSPFMEISVEFALTKSQVDNEATLHTARTLARLAARSVALAEDLLFFQGFKVTSPRDPKAKPPDRKANPGIYPARATNAESAADGLLDSKAAHRRGAIKLAAVSAAGGPGTTIFDEVTKGIAALVNAGQPGPYALILATNLYAEIFATVSNTTTTADRILPLVEGRLYGTGTLPEYAGLLVSLGGEPTTIYIAQDAVTAFTQEDQQGIYRFRVFERVQIVAREAQAFVSFEFLP